MKDAYRTVFREAARQDLRKLDIRTARMIFAKLSELESDPYAFGSTQLVGRPGHRRVRVGDCRVIYTVDNGELIVWVIEVGHRSAIYD